MKVRKAIGFDKLKQREIAVDFVLDKKQVEGIVKSFFDIMDYGEREVWLRKNVSKSKIICFSLSCNLLIYVILFSKSSP